MEKPQADKHSVQCRQLETPGYTAETNQGKQDKGSKTEYRAQKYGEYQNKTGRNLTSDGDLTRHRQHG